MVDLNDVRVFERVAALRSFSQAARLLDLPKSSVSRAVARLEAALAAPLLQRTTREVTLTEAGEMLFERCAALLGQLDDTLAQVGSLRDGPRGRLRITVGIGFGLNVLTELLPRFAARHPRIDLVLDLSSQSVDLVADRFDVAIRLGELPDSSAVAKRLGILRRHLCAAPGYLAERGTPTSFEALAAHDLLDLTTNGRSSRWRFTRGDELADVAVAARFSINCALTIHRMLVNGAGIGLSSGYLCAPEIRAGRLVALFPDWSLPAVPVHALFPAHRERTPAVRAFVDFMDEHSADGRGWQADL